MAMDELEIEAPAAVLVQMELGALAWPEDLADAQTAISAGLSGPGDTAERAIRQRASTSCWKPRSAIVRRWRA